jgi:phytoene synthase
VPEAPARIVERQDPDLFLAALFAPEPARGRLMTVYALDIELSRAGRVREADAGPLIARMRLQWWRDLIAGVGMGAEPRGHEVAGPLLALLRAAALPADPLEAMIAGREREIEGVGDAAAFRAWAGERFGGLLSAALAALDAPALPEAARAGTARALAAGFVLRNARAMAGEAGAPLPGIEGEGRAALARGEVTDAARDGLAALAADGLAGLREARTARRAVPRRGVPALLPLWRAERVLQAVAADAGAAATPERLTGPRGRAAAYAWRAATGRW